MPGEVIVLTSQRLSPQEWARAIAAQDYLAAVVLDPVQPDAGEGRWYARLDGRPVPFLVREVPVARFGPPRGPDGTPWRLAFAALSEPDLTRMSVAVAAVCAYAAATGGVGYDPEEDVAHGAAYLKQFADMALATTTGREAAYARRYGIADEPPAGPPEIHVDIARD